MKIEQKVVKEIQAAVDYVREASIPTLEKRNKTLASKLTDKMSSLETSLDKEFPNSNSINTSINDFLSVLSVVSVWHESRGATKKSKLITHLQANINAVMALEISSDTENQAAPQSAA